MQLITQLTICWSSTLVYWSKTLLYWSHTKTSLTISWHQCWWYLTRSKIYRCDSNLVSMVAVDSNNSITLLSFYLSLYCSSFVPLLSLYCPSVVPLLSLYCPSNVPLLTLMPQMTTISLFNGLFNCPFNGPFLIHHFTNRLEMLPHLKIIWLDP